MKFILHMRLVLVCCTWIPFAAHAADAAVPPLDRAHSLFNSFEVMCNLHAPDFDHLSSQASAMRMQVLEDISETPQAGETTRQKVWIGMLSTGTFALRAEKMSGVKGVATSCAIEGPVPDVDAFRNIVVKELHLTAPEIQTIKGSHNYSYNYSVNGTTVIIRDMVRPSGPFVQVKLLNMITSETH